MEGGGPKKRPTRVSLVPFGLGQTKPHNYTEVLRAVWRNKHAPLFTWRILRDGVCDGCALGTTGLKDFTMGGIHLCTVRLDLLPLNTMGPLDPQVLAHATSLQGESSRALRSLGRLPYPMLRRRGDRGFRRISWDRALDLAADRVRAADPDRIAFFLTSRGLTNETYYVAGKVARFLGTNHIDNSSRPCHSPSTTGLKQAIGHPASTCSYADWIGTDLIVFFGSDVPNNQPVTTKYLYYAKEKGTRIVVVNPFREPGLERYWIPSIPSSALFGTKLADRFFQIHTGGDIAFIQGVLKHLLAHDWIDRPYIERHTAGFEGLREELEAESWETLEQQAGVSRDEMLAFATMYAQARTAVFVWSMGITQHRFGVDNVKAIVNLALARGMEGREHCGLMPIRGHSGVQGGSEMGAAPSQYGIGFPVNEANAARFETIWGFRPPTSAGRTTIGMIDAAHDGRLDVLYALGGNFLETLPEPAYVEEALRRVPLRIHEDLVVTKPMLLDPADAVLLLPAQTRYEQRGGCTETSTERRVYLSPEIPGRRIGESRPEWEILMDLAERVRPEMRDRIHFEDAQGIREDIARTLPTYDGIQALRRKGDAFQWGGPRLSDGGRFSTPDGKAHFTRVRPPDIDLPEGRFVVSTRRGKQFNSMIHANIDPLLGASREDVLMSPEDARTLGLANGEPVVLESEVGRFAGRCRLARIRPGNLQIYWPEGNVIVRRGVLDPACEMPDYNAVVRVLRGPAEARA